MDFRAGQTLLFDKPRQWTSFDLVRKVRNLTREKKTGHAGTLDPLATGLLIICTGAHTKRIESIQGQPKTYEAVLKLGAVTASYDAEMPEEALMDASGITAEQVGAALGAFRGEISQVPPVFSAIKVNGKRAYESARKGEALELKPRPVTIYSLELMPLDLAPGEYALEIVCSKGTYIRSLAHDIGQALGVGAYLRDLRRTHIGDHHVQDAWTLAGFEEMIKNS
ncbi:MAG: tRNA pseudouridine(55) synthase TruB [Bacteroidia bacterium]|nr:tRNA pseudouridine(55) synthase TruB [Bacteroidia bacterium]